MSPSIVAFTVTPTSGEGPYTLSANISDSQYVDGVVFAAAIRYTSTVGSCPQTGSGVRLDPSQEAALVHTGSTISDVPVPSGSCRAYTLRISRVSDGAVVAISTVHVDNI